MSEKVCINTDKELWRQSPKDAYSDSVWVTKEGAIGMRHDGWCVVRPIEKWLSNYPAPNLRNPKPLGKSELLEAELKIYREALERILKSVHQSSLEAVFAQAALEAGRKARRG